MRPKLTSQSRKEASNTLCDALDSLKNSRERKDFVDTLFTNTEVIMLANRLDIAKMLSKEENYGKIKYNLKVGMSTIFSVKQKLLMEGSAYKFLLKRMEKIYKKRAEQAQKEAEAMQEGSWENVKKRYRSRHPF